MVIIGGREGNMKELGKRLKTARVKAGMSQRRLARESGISQGMISQIEAGNKEAGLGTMESLARTLGVSFSALCQMDPAIAPGPDLLLDKLVYQLAQTVSTMPDKQKTEVLRFARGLKVNQGQH